MQAAANSVVSRNNTRFEGLATGEGPVRVIAPSTGELSGRQGQILQALKRGYGEKQVAELLGISRHTVHAHVKLLYRRFSVTTRAELLSLWIAS